MNELKIPTIDEIDKKYANLIKLLSEESPDAYQVKILATALKLSIHTLKEHLIRQSRMSNKQKLRTQKYIKALEVAENSLPFQSLSTDMEQIRRHVEPSYIKFSETLNT
jgi:predicted DNA-binding protein (UPF0278 family)